MKIDSILEKVSKNESLNSKGTKKLLFITAFILIFLRILSYAWCSDDAFHIYTMAKNLLDGNGFTPTPGLRVNVATCPLWALVVTFGMFFWNNPYAIGMIFNFLFSGIALFLLFRLIYKKDNWFIVLVFVTAFLCFSKTYLSYSTSGLENALILLLGTLYLEVFFKNEYFSKKELFKIALLEGLIAFTRMDCALIFSFTSVYAFLFRYKKDESDSADFSWKKLFSVIPIALAGLSLFIFWELFSLFYYGSFVPNTALAKLNTGFPLSDYLVRGVWYVFLSAAFDFIIVFLPILSVMFLLLKHKKWTKEFCVAAGLGLYSLYIIYIGGDFMLGRHFLSLFWCALLLIFISKNDLLTKIFFGTAILTVIFYGIFQTNSIQNHYNSFVAENTPCRYTDEQQWYYKWTGLIPVVADYAKNGKISILKNSTRNGILWFYGIKFYQLENEELARTSYEYRLYDPLLSRLPAFREKKWRVGHMQRIIPEGYNQTLFEDGNYIKDLDLKFYYSKLNFVLSGDLFDLNRIKEFVKFYTGAYDHYLRQYIKRHKHENQPVFD